MMLIGVVSFVIMVIVLMMKSDKRCKGPPITAVSVGMRKWRPPCKMMTAMIYFQRKHRTAATCNTHAPTPSPSWPSTLCSASFLKEMTPGSRCSRWGW